jgi:hypothetical protein
VSPAQKIHSDEKYEGVPVSEVMSRLERIEIALRLIAKAVPWHDLTDDEVNRLKQFISRKDA